MLININKKIVDSPNIEEQYNEYINTRENTIYLTREINMDEIKPENYTELPKMKQYNKNKIVKFTRDIHQHFIKGIHNRDKWNG